MRGQIKAFSSFSLKRFVGLLSRLPIEKSPLRTEQNGPLVVH
jgi:hypothetical protein